MLGQMSDFFFDVEIIDGNMLNFHREPVGVEDKGDKAEYQDAANEQAYQFFAACRRFIG